MSNSIIEPIRKLFSRQKITFYEAECEDVDFEKQVVYCKDTSAYKGPADSFALHYDKLVVAVGAEPNTFGVKGVKEHTFFLKEAEHSKKIRSRLMDVLESISYPEISEEDKKKLLNFVIVGGGPTGVEFAAELKDFMNAEISKYFSHLKNYIKITIVQSGDHILNCYDEKISEFAEKKFKRDGIEVLTNCRVTEVQENQVKLFNKSTKQTQYIPFGMCVWVTGITQVPLVKKMCAKLGNQNNRVGKCR